MYKDVPPIPFCVVSEHFAARCTNANNLALCLVPLPPHRDGMYKKMESVIQQLLARSARLYIVCAEGDANMRQYAARACALIEVGGCGQGGGGGRLHSHITELALLPAGGMHGRWCSGAAKQGTCIRLLACLGCALGVLPAPPLSPAPHPAPAHTHAPAPCTHL